MPALLKIKREISNDVWVLNFSLDVSKLPESDKELMQKFGEPEINTGGTFLASTANEYILPDKYIKVRSGLPFTQTFDSKSPDFVSDTQAKAVAYQTAFVTKYTQAFTTLRTQEDEFTGEFLENI